MEMLHPVICVKLSSRPQPSLVHNIQCRLRISKVCSFFRHNITFYPQRVPLQCEHVLYSLHFVTSFSSVILVYIV